MDLDKYNHKTPGFAIGIVQNNKLQKTICKGLLSLKNNTKITINSNFRLASVSKQFTAYAILILISKKKLSLETNLKEIFPNFPTYGRKITIYHLLTHTSGLVDYEDLLGKRTKPILNPEILSLMNKQTKTKFIPGTKYKYSNTAYCLLASIIEIISKESFADYMSKNIFQSLGMKNTIVNQRNNVHINNRAYGYVKQNEKWIEKDQDITSLTEGDGGIYSSIKDLVKWSKELDKPTLIPKYLWKKANTKQKLTNNKLIDTQEGGYGFGLYIDKNKRFKVIRHGGESIGFKTAIYKVPKKDLTILILANNDANYGTDMAEEIIQKFKLI